LKPSAIVEQDDRAVEAVGDRRARRTARRVLRPKHEVVHEELRSPSEQLCQRSVAFVGVEAVVLLDPHPGELLPLPAQLVAPPGQLLLGFEQL
jgi:hypothetical protein